MTKLSRRSLNLSALGAALLSCCTTVPSINASPGSKNSVLSGEWVLNGLHSSQGLQDADSIASVTLDFGADGRASGYSGCNRFFGSYTVEGSSLTFGPLAGTKRACMGSGSQVESAVLSNLSRIASYDLSAQKLFLKDANGFTLLTYQRKMLLQLEGTEWDIIFYRRPNAIQSIVNGSGAFISFKNGGFSGSSGCNTFGGRFGQNDEFLKLTDLIMTEMACDQGLMEQESFIFDNLSKVRRWSDDGRSLWLQDADEANVLQLVRR